MKQLALAREDQMDDRWLGLQDCLRQSQNLAVAGQFAATIMHEINNPLEAISNLIFLVERNSDSPGLVLEFSQQIEEHLQDALPLQEALAGQLQYDKQTRRQIVHWSVS